MLLKEYDFEKDAESYRKEREENEEIVNNTDAKTLKQDLGICRNVIKSRDLSQIPFLVKSIKYNCIELNETFVFVNSNQKLEYYLPLSDHSPAYIDVEI